MIWIIFPLQNDLWAPQTVFTLQIEGNHGKLLKLWEISRTCNNNGGLKVFIYEKKKGGITDDPNL